MTRPSSPSTEPDPRAGRGVWAEAVAATYLERAGYAIRARRFRTKRGEIDLIAEKDGVIAFVEVRTRSHDRFIMPEATVGRTKQQRIARTAAAYLARAKDADKPSRFDVIAVLPASEPGAPPRIDHFEGAFLPEGTIP